MRSEKEIKEKLEALASDERLSYKPASVLINAPLALIQVDLKAQVDILKWVLREEK